MARQEKTSKRKYEAERSAIKCASCGNESKNNSIVKIGGIARWVCTTCVSRMGKKRVG